jgi:hypothetical protein
MNAQQLIGLVSANPLLYDLNHHKCIDVKLKEKVWDEIFTVVFNNKVLNNTYNINYIINIKYYFLLLSILLLFSKNKTLKIIYFSVTVSDVWIHFYDR